MRIYMRRFFVSAISLMKMHDGFPKFVQESFSMYPEKPFHTGFGGLKKTGYKE